jgi:hypothetical protein
MLGRHNAVNITQCTVQYIRREATFLVLESLLYWRGHCVQLTFEQRSVGIYRQLLYLFLAIFVIESSISNTPRSDNMSFTNSSVSPLKPSVKIGRSTSPCPQYRHWREILSC